MRVEVAIGRPTVGLGPEGSGEQALKNRLNAAAPRPAFNNRKNSRRDIRFMLSSTRLSRKPDEPSVNSYITFAMKKKADKDHISNMILDKLCL